MNTLERPTLTEIVKVVPTVETISLTWMIGARCNYDCMYCPPRLHDITSKHPDLEKLKSVWDLFYQKTCEQKLPYKIGFTGGEVTANKSFLPLIKYLQSGKFDISQVFVSTNGSASLRYYQELAPLVSGISFSTHSEFIKEKEFFNKVEAINQLMVRPEKSCHVNIMNEPWNQDRIKLYTKWLTEKNISHSVNDIDYTNQTRTYPILQGTYNFDQI